MEKVIIDSCVFFHMLKANYIYKNKGENLFNEYKSNITLEINNLKEKIFILMDEEFLSKYSISMPRFITLLNVYNAYIRDKLNVSKISISYIKNALKGEYQTKNGLIYKIDLSKERKQILENKLAVLENQYEIFQKKIKEFEILLKEYKEKYQPYFCTLLYDKMIRGEIEFFLVADSEKEINRHVGNPNNSINCFTYFDKEDVFSLLKNCKIINLKSRNKNKSIMFLSQEYRTRDDDKGSCMDGDKNSLKVYGDSRIMAEASIAGYTFITLNEKDFITDKSKKLGNDFIRRHIQEVNKRNPKIAHNIMIYSPWEYLIHLGAYKIMNT